MCFGCTNTSENPFRKAWSQSHPLLSYLSNNSWDERSSTKSLLLRYINLFTPSIFHKVTLKYFPPTLQFLSWGWCLKAYDVGHLKTISGSKVYDVGDLKILSDSCKFRKLLSFSWKLCLSLSITCILRTSKVQSLSKFEGVFYLYILEVSCTFCSI